MLNWSRFENGPVAPSTAFEAFSAQLFERWLRREHGSNLVSYTLHGAGGDGGVEAFGRLPSGEVIGLQAKWFSGNVGSSQIGQIKASLDRAASTHAKLSHYVVALRQNLTTARNDKERGGVQRWEAFVAEARRRHPNVQIVRWDEANLMDQLAHVGNQGLKAFWFKDELTQETLRRAWERARGRLNERYLPDLHVTGQIEDTLDGDLWNTAWVRAQVDRVQRCRATISTAGRALRDYIHINDQSWPPALTDAVSAALRNLTAWDEHAVTVLATLSSGPHSVLPTPPTTDALDDLLDVADEEKNRNYHHYTIANRAARAAEAALEACEQIEEVTDAAASTARPRVFVGPAGYGKTHAVTARVERQVDDDAPAVLLLARDCQPERGADALLHHALDLTGWPLGRILDALEALATIRHLRAGTAGASVGYQRALIVVDGLEEAPGARAWPALLSDLEVECRRRPRIHLVVTARPEYIDATPLPSFRSTQLDENERSLPAMLAAYAQRYEIVLTAVPWLGWVLRTAHEIRLFAEEYEHREVGTEDGANANALTLFRRKLDRLEQEARTRAGGEAWPDHLRLLYEVLTTLADHPHGEPRGWVPEAEVLRTVATKDAEYTARNVRVALRVLDEHGFVRRHLPRAAALAQPPLGYTLATRHLSDFILATSLAERTLQALAGSGTARFPVALLDRPDAASLYAAALAERGHFVGDVSWDRAPSWLRQLHAKALGWVPPHLAATRTDEIAGWLVTSTILNRAILRDLILPVSRIPGHPLGPRLLDAALRARPLADRDPVWSVPEDLEGSGPWRGDRNTILDKVDLNEADDWEGPPLIAAWTLSSVVEARRRRARADLAAWGAGRLDEMVKLLGHMADVDDPQIVDDCAVAALGAAIGARLDDPALPALALLMDRLFFADDASAWTESVPVRIAARGVVERAALAHPGAFDAELARARPPYRPRGPAWPPIDVAVARADGQTGDNVVTHELYWYISSRSIDSFLTQGNISRPGADERVAEELLNAVNEGTLSAPETLTQRLNMPSDNRSRAPSSTGRKATHGQSLAYRQLLAHYRSLPGVTRADNVHNGMIAALVRSWGWSEEGFSLQDWRSIPKVVDDSIHAKYGPGARKGARSDVARFREKYVWAAVDRVAGALADRLPVWNREAGAWEMLRRLSGIGNGMPDPLPRSTLKDDGDITDDACWAPPNLLPERFVDEPDPARRAHQWLTEAEWPEPRTLVAGAIESFGDGLILSLTHSREAHQACVNQFTQLSAFAIKADDRRFITRDARFVLDKHHDGSAWLEDGIYGSPALACWAPWLNWQGGHQGYNTFDERGAPRRIDIRSLWGEVRTRYAHDFTDGPKVRVPSEYLQRHLGVAGITGGRRLRHYIDRNGHPLAIERDVYDEVFDEARHYLTADRKAIVGALHDEGRTLMWVIRVVREVALVLWPQDRTSKRPPILTHRLRERVWMVLGDPTTAGVEVQLLRDHREPWDQPQSTDAEE